MSADDRHADARPRTRHGHDDHGHDHDDDAARHAAGYVTGFVLSVILTAIPFWLVMAKVLPQPQHHRAGASWASPRCRSSCT